MGDLDLDAVKALDKAATDGPWRVVWDSCDCGGEYGCGHGSFPHALRLPIHTVSYSDRPCDPNEPMDSYKHHASQVSDLTAEDVKFIAAARTALPELAAEVERLRTELAAAELVCDLHGITAAPDHTERGDALTQAWMDWRHTYGPRPMVAETAIQELARRRRDIRERTLARIRGRSQTVEVRLDG